MKILVPTKRVPDTDQKIRVSADGLSVDLAQVPFIINPFDAIALEEALRIRERRTDKTDVIAVGIGGDEYEKELRTGLAMGADRALLVHCLAPLDPWNVARLLQAVVERERPDLVLMGKQAVDDDANQTGQFLAALLGWPQATFASRIELVEGGLRVARETDAGLALVRVALPAVVTTDLRLNEPRYASLPSILKSRSKPIERLEAAELGVSIEPRIRLIGLETAGSQRSVRRVASVGELVDRLQNEAKVL